MSRSDLGRGSEIRSRAGSWTFWQLSGAVLGLLICLGCSAHRSQLCQPELGRTGFLQELLFPQGTARTPQFDDYTEGSYHVEKMDLLEGVRALRSQESVQGLVVYGPEGPIWTYYVFLFVAEDDQVRVNTLVFPHARITDKATRLLSPEEYRAAQANLTSRRSMISGEPSFETLRGERIADLSLDWHYSLLVADWSTGEERLWHSAGDETTLSVDERRSLTSVLNELLGEGTTTYSTTLPEGYETSICPDVP